MTEKEAFEELAKKYEDQGYTVTIEPGTAKIPFNLENYHPDLLCIKDGEHLLIEVKTNIWKDSVDKYKKIANIVSKHKGWKFLLIQYKDIENYTSIEGISNKPYDDAIDKVQKLLDLGIYDTTLVYLWSMLMSIYRQYYKDTEKIDWETSDKNIINDLYTKGLISIKEYDAVMNAMNLRNRAVHDIDSKIDQQDVLSLIEIIKRKSMEWKYENVINLKKHGL